MTPVSPQPFVPDLPAAWRRLVLVGIIATAGAVGLWSVVVALPVAQAEFGGTRANASLAFTAAMMGFGIGNIIMGRMTDRFGIMPVIMLGLAALVAGYVATTFATSSLTFALAHAPIGFGAGATFGPLMVEVSRWFEKRRGIAVALAASGNYFAGAIWPPLIERGIALYGWRVTHLALALAVSVITVPLLLLLRRQLSAAPPRQEAVAPPPRLDLGLSPNALTVLLSIAGVGCCVAMSMPQVHIVAYCNDLGYGVARGAEMLSLMLAFGVVSRIGSGFIADRIGGLGTLLLGSVMQAVALAFYLFFDGLASLYAISAMFGLFQGGIVPSYALVIRDTMPARDAGVRVGIVIFFTLVGMSFGGWISGVIFDATGSYAAAFVNGLAWNALNLAIALWLLLRQAPPSDADPGRIILASDCPLRRGIVKQASPFAGRACSSMVRADRS